MCSLLCTSGVLTAVVYINPSFAKLLDLKQRLEVSFTAQTRRYPRRLSVLLQPKERARGGW